MKFVNISNQLECIFSRSIDKIFGNIKTKAEITQSKNKQLCDYQCNSALKIASIVDDNPLNIAKKIISQIEDPNNLLSQIDAISPGFINITLNKETLAAELVSILKDDRLGVPQLIKKLNVVCEFSSPNIAKAMHVGHLRSSIIGDTIANLMEFLGHNVIRLNHIGDWGTQFGMLINYIKIYHSEVIESSQEADLEQLMEWYKKSKAEFDQSPLFKKRSQEEVVKLQNGDKESKKVWERICEISRRAFQEIYDLLDIHLIERGESFYNPYLSQVIDDFESKKILKIDGGAKCVFLDGFKNKEGEDLPLIIQKSDGGYNYNTTDLAGFKYRIEQDKADRIIIVTDIGQATHFQMCYQACLKVGYIDPSKVRFDHVPFGLVLTPDGKKFKTREGETERLIDLINEAIISGKELLRERDVKNLDDAARILGIGAVKYADLSCNRVKDYTFSYERMLKFEGNTAAYILYSFVRVESIKRKIGVDVNLLIESEKIALIHPSEIALGLHLRRFGESLAFMDEELLPNRLTDYLFHLAEKFHVFFRDCHVDGTKEQNSRLLLCELTGRIIKKGLNILGIKTMDKM